MAQTLAESFKRELRDGPAIALQQLMAMAMKGAAEGKPAAQRLLAQMLERENRRARIKPTARLNSY